MAAATSDGVTPVERGRACTASGYEQHNWGVDAPIPTTYARLEDEQRFVVAALPAAAAAFVDIEDRYLANTRLRLRRVIDGGATTYKLGHKIRLDEHRCSAVLHTTCYLDATEFALLLELPGATLTKRRWRLGTLAVDVFGGPLTGLVLLEGQRPVGTPDGAVEVTDDERFCGGSLAALGPDDATALLREADRLLA